MECSRGCAVSREWMLCLGQRQAYSHFAHLICELVVRLGIVGLSDGRCFQFGLTQEMVGDTLGISVVHVNRTLQELREEELVEWSQGVVEVKDWDRLVMAAQFDPTYLHLRPDRPGTEPLDGVLVGTVTK